MTSEDISGAPKDVSLQDALSIAMAMHKAGELTDADKIYRRILEAVPDQPDALQFLGLLVRQQGRRDEAIDLMRRAITAAPDYASAYTNLGNLLCESGDLDAAHRMLLRALELTPGDPRVVNNIGNIERVAGNLDAAREAFEKAVRIAPDFALPYENLGRHYYRMGDIPRAHDYFCHAVVHDPSLSYSKLFLGMALAHLGRLEEARTYYENWIKAEPDDPVPRHMLTTVCEGKAGRRADENYVRKVFDGFASTFDVHLQRLQYRAPDLVVSALGADGVQALGALDILDAGCGTGLCGPLLRPYARTLDGVDLSSGMLDKARAIGAYDNLTLAELTAFIQGRHSAYDVITCADTLCYFGDLVPVAKAVALALRAQGRFVFSVELAGETEAPEGYAIRHTGRYVHASVYVRETLEGADLRVRTMQPQTLRMEAGVAVDGLIVVASMAH